MALFDRFARPFLRAFEPETAHRLTLQVLNHLVAKFAGEIAVGFAPLGEFSKSVGVAAVRQERAGPGQLLASDAVSSRSAVTPLAQSGNPRPRVFRLDADGAVINRLGFNNDGEAAVLARLAARAEEGGIVGVNVGANRDSADRAGDYVRLIEAFAPVASYVADNVSSPDTRGCAICTSEHSRNARPRDRARERVMLPPGPTQCW